MKYRVIITGPRVHDVGYRPFLLQYALNHGFLHFFAMNTTVDGVEQVLVTLDENQEKINTFISYLSSNRPEFAEVSEIRSEVYGGDVVPIGTYLQDLQFEQLCKGIPAIISLK